MLKHLCNNRRVVVTGLGVVSSIGIGWEEFWKNLLAGKSGLSRIASFNVDQFDCCIGGEVQNFNPYQFMSKKRAESLGRTSQLMLAGAKLALKDAKIDIKPDAKKKISIFVGTTGGERKLLETIHRDRILNRNIGLKAATTENLAAVLGVEFDVKNQNNVFSTACAAGNYAIIDGFENIRNGNSDYAIVGGGDSFSEMVYTGFCRLNAVAPEKCQPFDLNRKGMIPAEGAGILFLESLESAKQRKANIYAEIIGYGLSCDANHMTSPDSLSVAKAMQKSLKIAGLVPEDVDYISAHGTGTIENDKAESAAYHEVFGHLKKRVPISSIKSMLGHTMGAAAALESIACCLAIKYGEIPPTINFENSDPLCALDVVPNNSRRQEVNVVLNTSQAFGGNNACLVFSFLKNA